MNPISLFPDYDQSENRVTNYAGLMLRLVYEESPALFQVWLSTIMPETQGMIVGPEFRQQVKNDKKVADLVIQQAAFSIVVETKLLDWHYTEQLKGHISDLGITGSRALLALAKFEDDHPERRHEEAVRIAKEAKVTILFLS